MYCQWEDVPLSFSSLFVLLFCTVQATSLAAYVVIRIELRLSAAPYCLLTLRFEGEEPVVSKGQPVLSTNKVQHARSAESQIIFVLKCNNIFITESQFDVFSGLMISTPPPPQKNHKKGWHSLHHFISLQQPLSASHVQPGDEHEWNLILKRHTDKPSDVMRCSS